MECSHSVDHRADIYSLGVVFYEMLTGKAPVGHFDPPSKTVGIDVRLDQVVLRSLAREPERRYQQASEVKTDLQSLSECSVSNEESSGSGLSPIRQQGGSVKAHPDWKSNEVDQGRSARDTPRILSTIRRAWGDWWAQRDRRLTTTIQGILVVLFLACQFMFFSFNVSQDAGPIREGQTIKRTTIKYGFPSPWFHLVHNPDKRTFHTFQIDWFASSVGIALIGFLLYGVSWQIEKAKAAAAGQQLRWWNGSPEFVLCVWAAMVIFAVVFGMHPLYFDTSS